jgi:hypothetical protein
LLLNADWIGTVKCTPAVNRGILSLKKDSRANRERSGGRFISGFRMESNKTRAVLSTMDAFEGF